MIEIRDRFKPFSHRPGSACMIPKSNWLVEAYPTEIRIVQEEQLFPIKLDVTGPVVGFTLEQDLEKDVVRVFGRAKEGYFHFEIDHKGSLITITLKRGKAIPYHFAGKKGVLEKQQHLEFRVEEAYLSFHTERLSLGMHKKLDWDQVLKRNDPKEIYPILFFLGQKIDPLYGEVPLNINQLEHRFRDMLVPLRESHPHLGLPQEKIPHGAPVAALLRKSYEAIRALFIQEGVTILTAPFVSGRMTGVKMKQAMFDLEWTKGKLRKVRIQALESGVLQITWPKEIESFRMKRQPQEKGQMIKRDEAFPISPGQIFYLDKFQK